MGNVWVGLSEPDSSIPKKRTSSKRAITRSAVFHLLRTAGLEAGGVALGGGFTPPQVDDCCWPDADCVECEVDAWLLRSLEFRISSYSRLFCGFPRIS